MKSAIAKGGEDYFKPAIETPLTNTAASARYCSSTQGARAVLTAWAWRANR